MKKMENRNACCNFAMISCSNSDTHHYSHQLPVILLAPLLFQCFFKFSNFKRDYIFVFDQNGVRTNKSQQLMRLNTDEKRRRQLEGQTTADQSEDDRYLNSASSGFNTGFDCEILHNAIFICIYFYSLNVMSRVSSGWSNTCNVMYCGYLFGPR